MKAPAPKFYKSWSPSHIVPRDNDPTREQSTADLLKWISDVTIKRRQIRRSTHCSNLFAEAILSSALKHAKRDLAHKQEEKRRKLQLFCMSHKSTSSDIDSNNNFSSDSDFELVKTQAKSVGTDSIDNKSEISQNDSYQVTMQVTSWKDNSNSNDSDNIADDEVQACLSSLESFFKELKSVKVAAF